MKLCLNTWMWRGQPLADALAAAREWGADGVELDVRPGSAHCDPLAGRDAVVGVKSQLGGLSVAALAADSPDLTRLEEDGGDEAVAHLVAALKRAADLRAGVVITTLSTSDVDAWDTVWRRGISALRMALFQTARSPVKLAVLLSGDDALDSLRKVRRLLEGSGDPRLGIAIDTGRLHTLRIPLPEVLLATGDRLFHVRLQDATRRDRSLPIGQGEVNFAASLRQLRAHGYRGAVSLSLAEGDPSAVAESLQRLQGWLAESVPQVDAPVAEAPAVETPVAEAPVVETPVAEAPAVETPVAEAPAAEEPAAVEGDEE